MANIKIYSKTILLDELYSSHYDKEKFLGFCKECRNYNNRYSCPPFNSEMDDYLASYNFINLIAVQLIYSSEEIENHIGESSITYGKETLTPTTDEFRRVLLELESSIPNSVSLSMGGCKYCEICNRTLGEECAYPDKMRISPEALGFDITSILKSYFDIDIQWADNALPDYFTLLAGICNSEKIHIDEDYIYKLFKTSR